MISEFHARDDATIAATRAACSALIARDYDIRLYARKVAAVLQALPVAAA